jgi:hypothetical protein
MKNPIYTLAFLMAVVCAARADVQIANEKPVLSGAIEQATFPADSRVCPGSPVVLTVGLKPALGISSGGTPVIDFSIVEGDGWFGTIEGMRAAPPGFFRLLYGRFLAFTGGRRTVIPLSSETGSTAAVFHPLGKEGDVIRIRAKGEGPGSELGSVDFIFRVGANRESLLSPLASTGLNNELRTEKLHYSVDEYADIKYAQASGTWTGSPQHFQRVFYPDKVVSTPMGDPLRKDVSSNARRPFVAKDSIYVKCRYWGETDTAIVGCLLDPDPPGPDGTLMLYYFDKGTGLMKEFRFYGKSTCGWGSFVWNPDVGEGLPYTIQIQRKVWNPPTKMSETADIFRENFKIMTEAVPTETPTNFDPNKVDETPVGQP